MNFFEHKDGMRVYMSDQDEIEVEDVRRLSDEEVKKKAKQWIKNSEGIPGLSNPFITAADPKDIAKGGIFKEVDGVLVRADS